MTREAALSGDIAQTSKFEYKYKSGKLQTSDDVTVPLSGGYGGYFCLQVPGKMTPIKVIENAMTLEFTSNTAGGLNVRGQGKNRYGPFTISGTCDFDGHGLELARAYAPKQPPVQKSKLPKTFPENRQSSGKDLSRVQAALSKPQSTPSILVAPATARSHKRRAAQASSPSVALDGARGTFEMPMGIYGSDSEGKRSGRARKAPSHLRDGSSRGTGSNSCSAGCFSTTDALKRCHAIVTSLERSAGADWFSVPVDAVALGVPHYGAIVDAPMDLGTVKRSLDRGIYTDPHAFAADMRLVFRNAMTFNVLPEASVHEAARDLHAKFEDQLKSLWKYLAGSTLAGAKAKTGFKRDADGDSDVTAPKRVKVANGKSGGKKSGKGKKGPREDDYGTLPAGTGMVPVADLVNMQRQMESMQATIAALQKQASQTEVQVQMNMELGVGAAAPASYAPSKVPRVSKPLTFAEKEALSNDINALPPDKLAHVVKIVQESMPLTSRHDDDEIEVDIETLNNDTLRHLQKYVKASLGKKRATTKKRSQQLPASPHPEITLTSDAHMLESVAFGGSGLGPGFDSDEDDDELVYDVLGA
jgi:hypothetical protein